MSDMKRLFLQIIIYEVKMSMEKNRMHPVSVGKGMRMSYSQQKEVLEMPNLIEIQKNSYDWFIKKGLQEVFDDVSPIKDFSGNLELSFLS